jgi:hypothetical protein
MIHRSGVRPAGSYFKRNFGEKRMNVVGRAACAVLLSSLAFGTASAANETGNPLVDQVRSVNSRLKDVSVAVAEGYAPIPCIRGVENPSVSCNHAHGK